MHKRTKIIISTLILWMAAAATEGFTSFRELEAATAVAPSQLLATWQNVCLTTSSCGVASPSLP